MYRGDFIVVAVIAAIFLGLAGLVINKIRFSLECRSAGGTPIHWQCVKLPLVEGI